MNKNFLKIVLLVVFAAVVVGGASLYARKAVAPTVPVSQAQAGTVSFSIQDMFDGKRVSISKDETVLQVLQSLNATNPNLKLSTKIYSGLGTLVDGIGADKNGTDKKYWQYKVNGIMPQIGADQYKLKSGDTVQWFFGASQE